MCNGLRLRVLANKVTFSAKVFPALDVVLFASICVYVSPQICSFARNRKEEGGEEL